MDIPRDELRRELKAADRANDEAMAAHQRALASAFEDDGELSADQKAGMLLGGLARRRFLTIGGLSVATAAVLAACGPSNSTGNVPQEGEAPVHHRHPGPQLHRRGAAAHGVVAGAQRHRRLRGGHRPARRRRHDAARLFQAHHTAHAQSLEQQTIKLGGEAFTTANPVVDAKVIQPALGLVKTATDALQLAHALEEVAAHTYQTVVPLLSVPALRGAIMTIGSIEARHAAVLAKVLGALPYPAPTSVPGAGAATTPAPTTTTTIAGTQVAGPVLYVVPGSFEPLSATQALLGDTIVSLDPLGPNSYAY